MRTSFTLVALLFAISPAAAAPTQPHPFLLADKGEIAAAKDKAARRPWARAALNRVMAAADAALARPAAVPGKVGQWAHWYSCPVHGQRLQTVSATQHRCPVDGHVFTGDPYDAVVIGIEHGRLAGAVRDLGLAWQFTGDRKYARHAAAILLAYAEHYPSYPRHNIRGEDATGGGKVLAQTLDEAVWLIPLTQGYDLVWDTLSPEERERIEKNVLLPAAEVIRGHKMGVHNIQCWKNSAVGLVGFVTGAEELVREAVDDPERGFKRQIESGVTADGLWYEGSMGYHQYTMQALWPLAEAARHAGMDLYSDRYRTMFLAPLRLALPDGNPPGFNDSFGGNVKSLANLYEIASVRWKSPEFGGLVAFASADGARSSLQALLYGAEELPAGRAAIPEESVLMREAGFAVLRARRGSGVDALAVRFGRHGGGHGHPDKPGIVLYGAGELLALDPGSIAYGVPLHREWYRTTVAHNTVSVDRQLQSNADGTLESWESTNDKSSLTATADRAYPGVRMRRSLSLVAREGGSVAGDVFEVSSDTEHTYDWVLHVQGDLASSLKFEPCEPAGDANGYQHIEGWQCARTDAAWEVGWTYKGARLGLKMKGAPGTVVYRGAGPGRNPMEHVPLILVRRKTAATVFDAELVASQAPARNQ